MQDPKRMADQANRMGQQAQEQMRSGLDAATKAVAEGNKNFQAIAAEIMNYSKRLLTMRCGLGSNSLA